MVVHHVSSPRMARLLRPLLVEVGTGVFVGDVNRRILDTVITGADECVRIHGGSVVVVAQSLSPQGFDVVSFGRAPVIEIDGLTLSLRRTGSGT